MEATSPRADHEGARPPADEDHPQMVGQTRIPRSTRRPTEQGQAGSEPSRPQPVTESGHNSARSEALTGDDYNESGQTEANMGKTGAEFGQAHAELRPAGTQLGQTASQSHLSDAVLARNGNITGLGRGAGDVHVPELDLSGVTADLSDAEGGLTGGEEGLGGASLNVKGSADAESQEADHTLDLSSPELDLSGARLSALPRSLLAHRAAAVTHLYLSGNQLRALPDPLATCLPSLTYLDLRTNLLNTVPAVLIQLCYLEVVLLQDNKIAVLPVQLGLLPRLQTVSYSGNPLLFPPDHVSRAGWARVRSYLTDLLTDADRAAVSSRTAAMLGDVADPVSRTGLDSRARAATGGGDVTASAAVVRGSQVPASVTEAGVAPGDLSTDDVPVQVTEEQGGQTEDPRGGRGQLQDSGDADPSFRVTTDSRRSVRFSASTGGLTEAHQGAAVGAAGESCTVRSASPDSQGDDCGEPPVLSSLSPLQESDEDAEKVGERQTPPPLPPGGVASQPPTEPGPGRQRAARRRALRLAVSMPGLAGEGGSALVRVSPAVPAPPSPPAEQQQQQTAEGDDTETDLQQPPTEKRQKKVYLFPGATADRRRALPIKLMRLEPTLPGPETRRRPETRSRSPELRSAAGQPAGQTACHKEADRPRRHHQRDRPAGRKTKKLLTSGPSTAEMNRQTTRVPRFPPYTELELTPDERQLELRRLERQRQLRLLQRQSDTIFLSNWRDKARKIQKELFFRTVKYASEGLRCGQLVSPHGQDSPGRPFSADPLVADCPPEPGQQPQPDGPRNVKRSWKDRIREGDILNKEVTDVVHRIQKRRLRPASTPSTQLRESSRDLMELESLVKSLSEFRLRHPLPR